MWVDMFPKDLPMPSVTIDVTPRQPKRYSLFDSQASQYLTANYLLLFAQLWTASDHMEHRWCGARRQECLDRRNVLWHFCQRIPQGPCPGWPANRCPLQVRYSLLHHNCPPIIPRCILECLFWSNLSGHWLVKATSTGDLSSLLIIWKQKRKLSTPTRRTYLTWVNQKWKCPHKWLSKSGMLMWCQLMIILVRKTFITWHLF